MDVLETLLNWIIILVVLLGLGIFPLSVIGAVVLQSACYFAKVKEPEFWRGVGITFVVLSIGSAVLFLLGLMFGALYTRDLSAVVVALLNGTEQDSSKVSHVLTESVIALIATMFAAGAVYSYTMEGVDFKKGLVLYGIQAGLSFGLLFIMILSLLARNLVEN